MKKSAFLPVALAFCILLLAGCTTLSQAQKKYLAEQAFPLQPGSGFPTDAFGDAALGISLLVDADVVPPAEIAPVVQLLRTGKQRGLSLLEVTIKKYPEQTRRFFGAHYTWVEQICRNYDMRQQFYDSSERQNSRDNDIRDKVMMSNFLFVLEQYPDENFFGQFGSEHIYQQPCETDFGSAARSRFGTLLNAQNSPVHGQVCSIVYFYYSSGVQDGQAWNPSSDYFDFSLFSPWFGQNVFFPLDEPGSIFAQAPAIVREGAADNACAYFQKAVLLSDSPRCTLYSSR